ncbi:MAG: DMT family transporter [Pseudolabrys sp.]|nr:DMT family transporter [Pseudolabrys sp.]MBV9954845.1 DMT family transporter [Pseudolabrys sp.]
MTTSREKLGLLLGFAATCGFSATIPVTRVGVQYLDPLFLTAGRATIAGVVAVIILLVLRRKPPPRELWGMFALTGFCVLVSYPAFLALALRFVPASHGGVVLGISPLAVAAAAALFGYERPSLGFWVVSLIGAGIVVAFVLRQSYELGDGGFGVGIGDIFLLGVVASAGIAYALSGRLSARMPGWEVITWQLATFLPLSAICAVLLWPDNLSSVPATGWIALVWISFVGQYFSFIASNFGMAMAGMARVGQLLLLQPFVVLAIAIPVNGEKFDWETLLFAAAVVATVVIGQRMRVTRK